MVQEMIKVMIISGKETMALVLDKDTAMKIHLVRAKDQTVKTVKAIMLMEMEVLMDRTMVKMIKIMVKETNNLEQGAKTKELEIEAKVQEDETKV